MGRKLTIGEKTLLRVIYGDTLPYQIMEVEKNDWPLLGSLGGKHNSITPRGTPHMAPSLYSEDYGSETSKRNVGVFIHEVMHVWQWYHGHNNILNAVSTAVWDSGINWNKLRAHCNSKGCESSADPTGRDFVTTYDDAYWYDLKDSNRLANYNFEAQASIVEDYWFVTQGLLPEKNRGNKKERWQYEIFINQLRTAGPPRGPLDIPLPTK